MDKDTVIDENIEDSIVCPECGHEQELSVMPSVNVTLDPEMREKVLSGDLFLFTCEKCGFSGFAGFPFIYEDKETNGGFLIYLEPECEDRAVGIEGDVADQVLLQNMTMRLVTNLNELKEKIFIFEAGLDDRVVELFKMLALSKMTADNADEMPDELRFTKVETVEGEELIVFAAFKEEEYIGALELPFSLYQSCLVTGSPIWDSPVSDCAAIDQQWIFERMRAEQEGGCGCEGDCGCDGECGEHDGGCHCHEEKE
ncbi:MAG: CpXC domain-containing protein [Methanocorpusculum sp.]|nr:CpXC domain-containing protein [Methanocorpusculum sp.]